MWIPIDIRKNVRILCRLSICAVRNTTRKKKILHVAFIFIVCLMTVSASRGRGQVTEN